VSTIALERSWLTRLQSEFDAPYMQNLRRFLHEQKETCKIIYPRGDEWFNALNTTPFDQVKVVILGQDPYHGPNQAHGLCFSVREGVQLPPSLINIYREIESDLGLTEGHFPHGCLTGWAEQGVLLLNSVLTVEHKQAASHAGKGWEIFTDRIVSLLATQRESVVFILWGSYAQKKGSMIDTGRHLVLKAPHPSPLSAHRGFFGCKHFSQCDEYLAAHGQTPIDWAMI
tara:strand:- start:4 stop:687 length:684 start_codon:yes stop_codon:yes gene_type:complete